MIGGAKGIGIGIDFGIPNQYCRATSKPYIEKDVLDSLRVVASAYGKTNEDSDRSIVKNLVDHDNPFVISNAAYTEGSGYADKDSPYYGAFVTDGIDDLITSTKTVQEMLVGSNEITVVSMIHLVQTPSASSEKAYTNQIRTGQNYLRNYVTNNGKTGIYGYTYKGNNVSVINNILGDKNDYTVENKSWNNLAKFSVIGYEDNGTINELDQVAWYWTIIANKVLTTDQINQVIAYFNLDRTLKPDILCDVKKQGITNENHAEFGDKLIDFSGNGRDIQLNNLAWKLDSSIGKYETDLSDTRIWTRSKEITSSPFSFSYNGLSGWILFTNTELTNSTDIPSFKIQIKGLLEGQELIYRYYDSNGQSNVYSMGKDGEYTLPSDVRTAKPQTSNTSGFQVVKNEANIITITQIPSHAGALCLDGVNDFGQFVGDLGLKDYTLIMNRAYNNLINNQVPLVSSNIVEDQTPFIVEHWNTGSNAISFSYGASRTTDIPLDINKKIVYQSTYSYMGYVIPKGNAISTGNGITLGKFGNGVQYSAICLWSLMLFPYSMSEFLIERQLKKHKLGTLYPDMVEFRPVIKSNVLLDAKPKFVIRGTSIYLNAGDYVPENSKIWINIKMNNIADRITKFTVNGKTIDIPKNAYSEVTLQYGFSFVIDKSPQKITMTIEQDENYVKFEPVITSNVEYVRLDFYLNNYEKRINIGDYIPKDAYIRANFYLKNNVDELTVFTFNGVNIDYRRSSVDDTAFNISSIYNYNFPQEVNITIDEYIRFEDIVQPYPVLLRFKDENGNEVSWGGKFRVGSTITRIGSIADPESNLLNGLYSISGLSLNGKTVTSSTSIVEKQMVFRTTATWLLDNNEPKVILSPRLLRIPNSSYKILGYIPDISGHGNHGVINNSAYAEGSGVNEDGSYQFNGVDDFVTIPTIVGGKQVLMKVNWQNKTGLLYDQRKNGSSIAAFAILNVNSNKSIAYNSRNTDGETYIDGILNKNIVCPQLYKITHSITIINQLANKEEVISPTIGSNTTHKIYFSQMSLYDFMLFDDISTEDKIKELNEYVGIEAKVELPPYYWDAYGKSNLDEDRDSIKQRGVAVGDYDLTNTNFAYDKMSGFGGYTLGKFTNSWSLINNSNSISIVSRNPYDITLKKLGENSDWEFNTTELKIISNPVSVKFKSDKNIRFKCDYHYYTVGGNSEGAPLGITSKDLIANEDTIITISPISQENIDKYNIDINRGYYLIYFQLLPTLAVNEEVTIEMLPLYPNGLVYDGVEDYSKNENIPVLTDYTIIAKRLWINKDNPLNEQFIHKGAINTTIRESAFMLEYEIANDTYYRSSSYGGYINIERSNRPERIVYQTSNSYNGTSITKGSGTDTTGIVIGGITNNYWNGVFYKLMLYSKTLPLLQINYLKNLMERDEIIDLNNPIFIQE